MQEHCPEPPLPPVDRSHWPTSIGSLRDMKGEEADLSKTTTCEERFALMWQLAQDAWAFRGEPLPDPAVLRTIGRVIRGKTDS